MSDTRETLEQALRAVDASLSVLVVTRDQIINALETLALDPAGTVSPGAVPADPNAPCTHPLSKCVDVGVASGVMVCECGEEVTG